MFVERIAQIKLCMAENVYKHMELEALMRCWTTSLTATAAASAAASDGDVYT